MDIIKIVRTEYLNRFQNKSWAFLRGLLYYYREPCFRVIVLTRLCTSFKGGFGNWCYKKLKIKYGVTVARTARIGEKLWVEHYDGIVVGRGAVLGSGCILYQQVTIGQNRNEYPVIGNNVIIYSGAKVFGNIHIGNNVVIGANAVVNSNVPDNSVVAGVPAKIIGSISE